MQLVGRDVATAAGKRYSILLLLAALGLLYLAYPARTYGFDPVIFASAALRGDSWIAFDPGHLGYGPIVVLAAKVGRMAHPPLSPIFLLQYLSMAAGVAGAYAFYRTLVGLGAGSGRAVVYAGILCCTYGYWHFALQAEPHIVSTVAMLFFLERFSRLVASPSRHAAAWAGVVLGLATLMHQQNILMVGPALVALPIAARGGRRLATVAGVFLAAYGAIAILPYLAVAVGALDLRTIPAIRQWIIGIGGWGIWGHWTRATFFASGVGLVRSFVEPNFLLRWGPARAFAFAHGAWVPGRLPIAAAVPPALCAVLALLMASALVLGVIAVARRVGNLGSLASRHASLTAFLLAWLLVHGVFAAWWAPRIVEFWIDFFPPLLVLLAIPLDQGAERRGHGFGWAGAFFFALAAVNFFGNIRPEALPTVDPETNVAIALDATVNPGDAILIDSPLDGIASRYARVFRKVNLLARFPSDAIGARDRRFRVVDSLLVAANSAHRRVFLVATPLASQEERKAAYRGLVASLATRYDIEERVPIRADIDLRGIHRRRGELR
jgi:hypothetical protein